MKKTEIEVIGLCFLEFRFQNSDFRFQISYFASLERLFLALRGTIFTQSEFSEFSFRLLLPRLPEYNV